MTDADVKQIATSWFLLIKDHIKLLSLESELAQISVFPLLISGLTMTFFALTFWILLLIFIGYAFFIWGYSPIICLMIVLGINVFALIMSYFSILKYKNRMRFEHTRNRLKEILK